jgi:hypothetical protein
MVTAVPAFFGRKARTRKPAAVDVTVLFDTSGSNNLFVEAFKSKTNITAIDNALKAEGVGTGIGNIPLNRYSIGGFDEALWADTNPDKVFIDGSQITNSNWGQDDAGYDLGSNVEDETGAIYAIARPNGPRGSLGAFRSKNENIARIVISESTEEATNKLRNGQQLDSLMRTEDSQILVFIDGPDEQFNQSEDLEPICTELNSLISAGTVPAGYRVYGFVFTGQTEATVIFSPNPVTSSTQLSDLTIVKNIAKTTLTCQGYNAGVTEGPNSDSGSEGNNENSSTNTGHYAELTGGAVLALTACGANFPLTFAVLGKILGELLFDASL